MRLKDAVKSFRSGKRPISINKSILYSILTLRVLMSWMFIQSGLIKISDSYLGAGWSSAGFLYDIPKLNPFSEVFYFLASYPEIVDPLVMFGQLLIGISLMAGIFFRFAALMGAIQMTSFWMASFEAGLFAGLPVTHGFIVNDTLIYAVLLINLAAIGAGRFYGLDQKIEKKDFVQKRPYLKYILG